MSIYQEQSGMPTFIMALFILQLVVFGALHLKTPSVVYIGIMGVVVLVGLLLFLTKLTISVSQTAIDYRFFPFFWKTKTIPWTEVERAELVKVSALNDFSGWGLRYSGKLGWGYITSADFGLRLKKRDGSQITLSLKNKDEFIRFLRQEDLIERIIISSD